MVRDLERRVRLSKANVESIKTILSKWCEKPLYQRKDDKKDCLLNLEVNTCVIILHTHIYKYILIGANYRASFFVNTLYYNITVLKFHHDKCLKNNFEGEFKCKNSILGWQ